MLDLIYLADRNLQIAALSWAVGRGELHFLFKQISLIKKTKKENKKVSRKMDPPSIHVLSQVLPGAWTWIPSFGIERASKLNSTS